MIRIIKYNKRYNFFQKRFNFYSNHVKSSLIIKLTRVRDYESVYYDLLKYVTKKPSSFNENIFII